MGFCMFERYVKFQSTGSVWSPTVQLIEFLFPLKISIHGLRVEPDALNETIVDSTNNFNPRAPCGARHVLF